jgi:hypothetical protein
VRKKDFGDRNLAPAPQSIDDYLRRYPRVCAAVIAYSLGYATPRCAANILKDAHDRNKNYCEWIYECYRADPLPAVQGAIHARRHLRGYMSDYRTALALVRRANDGGEQPVFASWF